MESCPRAKGQTPTARWPQEHVSAHHCSQSSETAGQQDKQRTRPRHMSTAEGVSGGVAQAVSSSTAWAWAWATAIPRAPTNVQVPGRRTRCTEEEWRRWLGSVVGSKRVMRRRSRAHSTRHRQDRSGNGNPQRRDNPVSIVFCWEPGPQDLESSRSSNFFLKQTFTLFIPIIVQSSDARSLLLRVCLGTLTYLKEIGNVSSSGIHKCGPMYFVAVMYEINTHPPKKMSRVLLRKLFPASACVSCSRLPSDGISPG